VRPQPARSTQSRAQPAPALHVRSSHSGDGCPASSMRSWPQAKAHGGERGRPQNRGRGGTHLAARPTRCTNSSGLGGKSRLMTLSMSGMSMPRAATSVVMSRCTFCARNLATWILRAVCAAGGGAITYRFIGGHPNPLDLIQPKDAMAGHGG